MIAFKHPEYLFFLLAIAIPIIIHLFSFRRYKKIYYHDIHLIKNIQIEQNSTKSKLKELLILLCRIGFIAFLVLTFAQPYIPLHNGQSAKHKTAVAMYIDNSFSTQAESSNGVVLEYEKKKAQEIADAYSAETQFFLFTNSANSTEQFPRTREELKTDISKITLSANRILISDVIKKFQTCAAKNETELKCHVLSDFQKNTADLKNIVVDSTLAINYYPIDNESINTISIDSCYFENQHHIAGQTEKITAIVSNKSDETFTNFPIKLFINDTMRALSSATLKPHKTTSVPIEYSTASNGIVSARLEIEDFPILYDNTYFFSYTIDNQISILDIAEEHTNTYIQALCKNQKSFSITTQSVKTLDYASISNFQIIILDGLATIPNGLTEEIKKLHSIGKTIVCFPSEDIDIESYNRFLSLFGNQKITTKDTVLTSIETIDEQNALFKNVFDKDKKVVSYPEVHLNYRIEPQRNNSLVTLQNTNSFVLQSSSDKNTLFFFTVPFSEKQSSFVTSPLFVGVYNMLMYISASQDLQTNLGNTSELFLANFTNDEALHIANSNKNVDIIPQYHRDIQTGKIHINPMQQITDAGNYLLIQKNQTIGGISYNFDRNESVFEFYSSDEIQSYIENQPQNMVINPSHEITNIVKELSNGKPLWRIVLCIAIAFILFEILIILFYDKVIIKNKDPKNLS